MKRPLVWGSCFYIIGILLGNVLVSFLLGSLFFLIFLLGSFYFASKYQWQGVYLLPLLFFLGFLQVNTVQMRNIDAEFNLLNDYNGSIMGKVQKVYHNYKENSSRFIVLVDSSYFKEWHKKSSVAIQLHTDLYPDIQYQDNIWFQGQVQKLEEERNPGGFNQKRYGLIHGFDFICFGEIKKYISTNSNSILHVLQTANQAFQDVYDAILPPAQGSILKAMILGNRQELETKTQDLYKKTGISHILSISGLHISILGFLLLQILQWIQVSRRSSAILTIFLLMLYGAFVGNSVSTMRAIIMMSSILGGYIFFRTPDIYTSIAFSALFLLFKNPFYLWDIGFQLSYGAVLGLVLLSPLIEKLYMIPSFIRSSLSASVSATLATLPIVAYHFYYIPLYGVITNLILIPFVMIIVLFGMIGGLIGLLSIVFGQWAIGIVYYIFLFYELVTTLIIQLPYAYYLVGAPSWLQLFLYYGILILTIYYFNLPKHRRILYKKGYYISLIVLGVGTLAVILCPTPLEITFLDVGQGDSIVIHTPTNQHFLIDGGGYLFREEHQDNTGKKVIQPYLEYKGVHKLDGAFLSHPHGDHILGLIEIIGEIPIDEIFVSGTSLQNHPLYRELDQKAITNQIPIYSLAEGELLQIGDLSLRCLFIGDGSSLNVEDNWNTISMVLYLEYGEVSFLFTGDIESEEETYLVSNYQNLLSQSSFLKVPHHGSNTSSTSLFLDTVNPIGAIISSGRNNRYGHPHSSVIERYEERNISLYHTAQEGAIVYKTFGKKTQVYSILGKRKEIWNGKTEK